VRTEKKRVGRTGLTWSSMEEDETVVVVKAEPDPPLWAVPPALDRRGAEEGAHGKRVREEGLDGEQ
jgi:hypothetical protein